LTVAGVAAYSKRFVDEIPLHLSWMRSNDGGALCVRPTLPLFAPFLLFLTTLSRHEGHVAEAGLKVAYDALLQDRVAAFWNPTGVDLLLADRVDHPG
jgi:hypothetical protein